MTPSSDNVLSRTFTVDDGAGYQLQVDIDCAIEPVERCRLVSRLRPDAGQLVPDHRIVVEDLRRLLESLSCLDLVTVCEMNTGEVGHGSAQPRMTRRDGSFEDLHSLRELSQRLFAIAGENRSI